MKEILELVDVSKGRGVAGKGKACALSDSVTFSSGCHLAVLAPGPKSPIPIGLCIVRKLLLLHLFWGAHFADVAAAFVFGINKLHALHFYLLPSIVQNGFAYFMGINAVYFKQNL